MDSQHKVVSCLWLQKRSSLPPCWLMWLGKDCTFMCACYIYSTCWWSSMCCKAFSICVILPVNCTAFETALLIFWPHCVQRVQTHNVAKKSKVLSQRQCRLHVSLVDITMSCAKMAERIKMPIGLWTRVGPKKPCVICMPRYPPRKGQFWRQPPLLQTFSKNFWSLACFQCFDAVGWAAGRASGL